MKAQYLTIRQFASLRGVSIGSMRYYEKLGLLKPAYTDPRTHYRYYTPEQLAVLDAIQLCVSLDIPLKQLKKYMHGNVFSLRDVLCEGRDALHARIDDLTRKLSDTESALQQIEENSRYLAMDNTYERDCPVRWYDSVEIHQPGVNFPYDTKQIVSLISRHQKENPEVLSSQGFLFTFGRQIGIRAVVRTAHVPKNRRGYVCMPAGTYVCAHIRMAPDVPLEETVRKYFPRHTDEPILVTAMLKGELIRNERIGEIQILKSPHPVQK